MKVMEKMLIKQIKLNSVLCQQHKNIEDSFCSIWKLLTNSAKKLFKASMDELSSNFIISHLTN